MVLSMNVKGKSCGMFHLEEWRKAPGTSVRTAGVETDGYKSDVSQPAHDFISEECIGGGGGGGGG